MARCFFLSRWWCQCLFFWGVLLFAAAAVAGALAGTARFCISAYAGNQKAIYSGGCTQRQSRKWARAHRAACLTKLPRRKELRRCTQGSIALSLCTTALPLHTIFAHIFGASISETKIRPNPRYTLEAEAGGGGVVRSHCCITARPLYTTECNAADVACACYLGRHVCASSSWRTCDTLCVLIRPTVPRDSAPPLLRRRRGRPPGGGLGEDELEVEVTAAALAAPCSSYCVVKLLW